MYRVGAGMLRSFEDFRGVQIALRRRRRTNVVSMVGLAHMQRRAIGIRIHGDRFDSQLAAGADDPHRDLSAVGDKYPFEHQSSLAPAADSEPGPSLLKNLY